MPAPLGKHSLFLAILEQLCVEYFLDIRDPLRQLLKLNRKLCSTSHSTHVLQSASVVQ
jgi:hypothetical protein